MFLGNYALTFLVINTLIVVVSRSIVKMQLPRTIVYILNVIYVGTVVYSGWGEDHNVDKIILMIQFIIGSMLIISINKKKFDILNLQLLIANTLIFSENILVSFLGLVMMIKCNSNRKAQRSFILIPILLTIIAVLQIVQMRTFSLASFSSTIPGNPILVALISVMLLIGPMMLIMFLLNKRNEVLKNSLSLHAWIWLGIIYNYFIYFSKNYIAIELLPASLINLMWLIIVCMLIILTIEIENSDYRSKALLKMITFNQTLFLSMVLTNIKLPSYLLYSNAILLLIYMIIPKLKNIHAYRNLLKVIKYLMASVILAFLLWLPLTPWLEYKIKLLDYLASDKFPLLVLIVLILSVRLRQNIIFICKNIRPFLSKGSKAS